MTTPFTWTGPIIAKLQRLWAAGKSAGQIADALGGGTTRNAVLGKLHRLRLRGETIVSKSSAPPKAKPQPKPRQQHSVTYGWRAPKESLVPPVAIKATPHDTIDPKTPTLLRMEDLKAHHCRWPLNNALGGEYYFCGERKISGKPYCQTHCDVAYPKPKLPKRNTANA